MSNKPRYQFININNNLLPDMYIDEIKYVYIKPVGYGAYRKSYLYRSELDGKKYIIKLFFPYKDMIETYNIEIFNLQKINELLNGCQSFIIYYRS